MGTAYAKPPILGMYFSSVVIVERESLWHFVSDARAPHGVPSECPAGCGFYSRSSVPRPAFSWTRVCHVFRQPAGAAALSASLVVSILHVSAVCKQR